MFSFIPNYCEGLSCQWILVEILALETDVGTSGTTSLAYDNHGQ